MRLTGQLQRRNVGRRWLSLNIILSGYDTFSYFLQVQNMLMDIKYFFGSFPTLFYIAHKAYLVPKMNFYNHNKTRTLSSETNWIIDYPPFFLHFNVKELWNGCTNSKPYQEQASNWRDGTSAGAISPPNEEGGILCTFELKNFPGRWTHLLNDALLRKENRKEELCIKAMATMTWNRWPDSEMYQWKQNEAIAFK